jgi:hypothetical protein
VHRYDFSRVASAWQFEDHDAMLGI